jgi:hypothetical protein
MTVSASEHRRTLSETEVDRLIHAGAEMGMGWEDILDDFRKLGIEADREHVRSIVIPKRTTASQRGTPGGRNAAG